MAVEEAAEKDPAKGPVVVELFSSQACVFCPKADVLLGELASVDHIIGLACHVDYFDVQKGSLARPFCTDRQTAYQAYLRTGPNFTPQMIVNGRRDVVGYRLEAVSEAVQEAAGQGVARIGVKEGQEKNSYILSLPAIESPGGVYELWLAVQDKRHDVTIAEGMNKGQAMAYINIVSALELQGEWDGQAKAARLNIDLGKKRGFAILAQNKSDGFIYAAGEYVAN